MSRATFIVGDTRDVVATLTDGSVDLVMTSPPFLALRSYLPADHPDKHREIGSEPTPADFLDTLLELTAEWRRVLAPHGSIAVELGDTYSGTGTGDPDATLNATRQMRGERDRGIGKQRRKIDEKWPLAKSLALIPELYRIALAYGINPLTGAESPAGRWRVRNVVRWVRPNPPVGALGDKYRPATSDLVIACTSSKRWFDLDAVRTPHKYPDDDRSSRPSVKTATRDDRLGAVLSNGGNPAGAPPLDWWNIPPGGYSGKVTTTRRVPCGPGDGGERIASPGCPVHGDRDARTSTARRGGRGDSASNRTPRTDFRHAPTLLDGSEPSDATRDRSGSTPGPTTETTRPECSPAATPHSTASSRTGHGPATTSPDTASAGTAASTADTPASPECGEHHPGTAESRTSADDSTGTPSFGTADGTAGSGTRESASSACTCSYEKVIEESTSHYAVYPPELCVIPIKSMCPAEVCRACGEPRRRIVETDRVAPGGKGGKDVVHRQGGTWAARMETTTTTLGWTDCGCDAGWRPGVVLDPFGGSGTTGMVATGHGRDAILVDLDERNADLARERIGMFLDVVHHEEAQP